MRPTRALLASAGLLTVAVAGCLPTHAPRAELVVDPTLLEVPADAAVFAEAELSNLGEGDSEALSFDVPAGFVLDESCAGQDGGWLQPDEGCTLRLSIEPGTPVGTTGTLTITAANASLPTLLELEAVQGEPHLYAFPIDVSVPTDGSVGATVQNDGTADAVIQSVVPSAGYALADDQCTGQTISPGLSESCLLGLTAAANAPSTGTLTVTEAGGSQLVFNLTKAV